MSKCTFQGHKTIIEEKPRNITHQTNSECLNQSLIPAWTRLGPARPQLVSSFLIYIPPPARKPRFQHKEETKKFEYGYGCQAQLYPTHILCWAWLNPPSFYHHTIRPQKVNTLSSNYWAAKCWSKLGSALPQLVLLTLDAKQKENLYKNKMETMSTHTHVQNLNVS